MIESECRISWEIDEAILPIAAIFLSSSIPLCLLRREDLFEPTSPTIDSANIKAPSHESEKLNLDSSQLSAIFTWRSLRCPKARCGPKSSQSFSPAQLSERSEVHWVPRLPVTTSAAAKTWLLSRIPAATRDLTLLVPQKIGFDSYGQAAKEAKAELPLDVIEVDVFIASRQNQSTERSCTCGDENGFDVTAF